MLLVSSALCKQVLTVGPRPVWHVGKLTELGIRGCQSRGLRAKSFLLVNCVALSSHLLFQKQVLVPYRDSEVSSPVVVEEW